MDTVAERFAQFFAQDQFQHVEMVVLLVAHHIDHLLRVELFIAELGGTQVLRHIDGGAVFAKQHFLVQPLIRQVDADGAVVMLVEGTFVQTFLHEGFAQQVGFGFVVCLVEMDAKAVVGDVGQSRVRKRLLLFSSPKKRPEVVLLPTKHILLVPVSS